MSRPQIYQTLGEVAQVWAKRSTCSRRAVGAVIATHQGVILSSGYNGAPAGMDHCAHACRCIGGNFNGHHSECPSLSKCTTAIHAEENAILFAARGGRATYGTLLVTTYGPCLRCARMIHQAGINTVWWIEPNHDLMAADFLGQVGITYGQIKMG